MEPLFALLTSDLHLSEKGDDQYRFNLFPWIIETYKGRLKNVIITGDLSDMKDRHADWFVNMVVHHIKQLGKHFNVYILKGNHDYHQDPTSPFFGFLDELPNVHYIWRPVRVHFKELDGYCVFLPHTRTPKEDWTRLIKQRELFHHNGRSPKAIFCHQTFKGAKSETGYELDGLSSIFFRKFGCPVFSGDVHVPQRVGGVNCVGCPYHVHFGDKFRPRVILLHPHDGLEIHSEQFPAPKKIVADVTCAKDLYAVTPKIRKGDHVKVRVHLPRSEFVNWPGRRDGVKLVLDEIGAKAYSVTLKQDKADEPVEKQEAPKAKVRSRKDAFRQFCKKERLKGNARDVGLMLMEDE